MLLTEGGTGTADAAAAAEGGAAAAADPLADAAAIAAAQKAARDARSEEANKLYSGKRVLAAAHTKTKTELRQVCASVCVG